MISCESRLIYSKCSKCFLRSAFVLSLITLSKTSEINSNKEIGL